ncbi:30S ribosomal protein S7 [Candidatus Woesearchaeota archaeon]|nr:30S ribosomal protein S7 [Candidatus Woesearchaeota archaeon]
MHYYKMNEIKTFGKWSTADIKVRDPGLVDFIALKPVFVPRTGARYAQQRFYKSKISIVERLINKLMVCGHKGKKHRITSYPMSGKALQSYAIVQNALSLIESKTKNNPVEVLVRAVENAAPREEIVSIEYGGARYPKAVECAPQRRIDVALRYMVQGAYGKSFNSKRNIIETLAEEIINASKSSAGSNAISRKLEIERQADTSR